MDVDGVANVISFDVIVSGRPVQLGRVCIHYFGLDIHCKQILSPVQLQISALEVM